MTNEKKKITIYSVAKEAGVSLATVSRVINDSGLVKQETKEKVEAAIAKLGYRPNAVAQGLALKKTTTIALVIPDSSMTYIGKIINGILDVAKIYNYNITLHTTSETINEMSEIVDNVVKSRADGVIIYNDSLTQEEMDILNSYAMPTVYVGQKVECGENACNVYVDYEQALYELTTRYLNKGIDDIILIEDRKNTHLMDQLVQGVERAYGEHGKSFDGYVTVPSEFHNSYEYLNKYFAAHRHQLVISLRDSQAVAVLNTCLENGIAVPDETEVVSIMNSRINDMVRPRISSFVIPSYDIGAVAMRVIQKMLNSKLKDKESRLNYIYEPKSSTKN